MPKVKLPRKIREFLPWIKQEIEEGVDFFSSEFEEDWANSERYFNGETDLPSVSGRSRATSTTVRDSIRNLKPSVLRVLLNSKQPVEYIPSNIQLAPVVEQQTAYVTQLFYANDGYKLLYDAVDESFKKKICPVKVFWEENPTPEFIRLTGLTADEVIALEQVEDVTVLAISEREGVGDVPLYDVECERDFYNGRIVMEAVPVYEFFCSRNASNFKKAIHGHRRSVTVAEAIDLGLDYKKWEELTDDDPEQNQFSEQSREKRGYDKKAPVSPPRGDVLSHRFLLTEAYVELDLEDDGHPQLYCVWFGGSDYRYLGHERETETPFEIFSHDPKPFTVAGTSIYDVAKEDQDTLTSLLRGILDNVHMGNNPRIGANPQTTNFDDLMSFETGHPIRMKQNSQMQVIQIPSNIQSALPLLQHLGQDSQNKIGVTKAAQGLDPNALQSTDKDAVRNTIATSSGQIELMARNLVETGLIPVFRKLLRLSIQHLDRVQAIRLHGQVLPVDQLYFCPDLYARPNVGLGSATEEMQMAGLNFVLQQQMNILQNLGMNNPVVSISNIYNTLEDLTQRFGLHDVGRYFNYIDQTIEAQYAEERQKELAAQEQAKQPVDPGMALIESEKVKGQVEQLRMLVNARTDAMQAELKAIQLETDDDFKRDQMAQELEVKRAEIIAKTGIALDVNAVKREQEKPRAAIASRVNTDPLAEAGNKAEGAL